MSDQKAPLPGHSVQAHAAGAIRVVSGANLGDAIGAVTDCIAGDVYRLHPEARLRRLVLCASSGTGAVQKIAQGSEIGAAGDQLSVLALLTLLAHDGDRLAIVTIRHEPSGAIFALPLSPMLPKVEYTLVDLAEDPGDIRLADII